MFSLDLILLMLAARRAGRHGRCAARCRVRRRRRSPRPCRRSPAWRWSAPRWSSGCTPGPSSRSATASWSGQQGVVTERITGLEPGRIKLGGEIWSAQPVRRHPGHRAGRAPSRCWKSAEPRRTSILYPASSPSQSPGHRSKEYPWAHSIVLILLVLLFLFVVTLLAKTVRIVPQARAGIVERFGKYKQTLPAGLNIVVPFIDKVRYLIDLREQVVQLPAAAGDHRGQPGGLDRHRHLLPGHRPDRGDLRDRQLHPGRRAAHHDHAAQHRRWHGPRADADQPRGDQPRPARRPRRGDRQVGHPRQPRRDQGHRPAAVHQGRDGEADARRPGQARADPHRRGPAAVRDPHRRGQQAVRDPERRG